MHKLHELKEKLIRELEDYAGNSKFSKEDVESIKYITSAVDHICNITEREDGDYSEATMDERMPYARGSYRSSYARGRNARRDSMGRYSSDVYSEKDEMATELRRLMGRAPEGTKSMFRNLIEEIEHM